MAPPVVTPSKLKVPPLVAKMPVKKPPTMAATKCVWNTSRQSSTCWKMERWRLPRFMVTCAVSYMIT